ncbi:MAG: hypothetical protein ACJ77K_05910 [Bacteroidia bacterium]
MDTLENYIQQINRHFREQENRYKAHELCKPLLLEMAKDPGILYQIIAKNLSEPGFLSKKRDNPVIRLDIDENETLTFVAHCWLPLPDRRSDLTHQSIHHHGKLLLTSVSAWGPGYESVIFQKGFTIDKTAGTASMKPDKIYRNHLHNIEFIDTDTPHVVFYPADVSITYALWSNAESTASENIKKIGFVNRYKKQLRKVIDAVGAAKLLGLNTNEYLDFYPENGKIIAMKDRVKYAPGSNQSFVNSFFHLLQQTGYTNFSSIANSIAGLPAAQRPVPAALLAKLRSGEKISDEFDTAQMNIPHVNFERETLMRSITKTEI